MDASVTLLVRNVHQQRVIEAMKHKSPPTAIPTRSRESADLVEGEDAACFEGTAVGGTEGKGEG